MKHLFTLLACAFYFFQSPLCAQDQDINDYLYKSLNAKQYQPKYIKKLISEFQSGKTISDYEALDTLGAYFEDHDDAKQNFKYKKLIAEHDYAENHDFVKLACLYWFGRGTPQNQKEALSWIEKAAENNDTSSAIILMNYYKQQTDVSYLSSHWERRAFASVQSTRLLKGTFARPLEYLIRNQLKYSRCPDLTQPLAENYDKIAETKMRLHPDHFFKTIAPALEQGTLSDKEKRQILHYAKNGYSRAFLIAAQVLEKSNPQQAIYWLKKDFKMNAYRFSKFSLLSKTLRQEGLKAEAQFWDQLSFNRNMIKANAFYKNMASLTEKEKRTFDLMYDNWAFNGVLP